jgi:TPP-dependent pyruvate/acetoin dehydrogenase alpha subunit
MTEHGVSEHGVTGHGSGTAVGRRAAVAADRVGALRRMVEIRLVEDKVMELFADGVIAGTTHTSQGQEAVAVGLARALRVTDLVMCTYRGHGIALALGVTPQAVLGEIVGRRIGCMGGLGGSMHLSDPSVGLLPTSAIVGAGLPIAAGAALTAQVLGEDRVAVGVCGDGAANIGAFHEALNLAAIWTLPVVFLCENNLYGEYSRIQLTTPVENLADRAGGYGIPGVVVDGQDVDAVQAVIESAVARARGGAGPTLIEAKTYRYSGHSRSDQGSYRPSGELEHWRERDPVELFGHRLIAEGRATPAQIDAIWEEQRAALAAAVGEVLDSPAPEAADMFTRVLAGPVPAESGS